MCQDNDESKPSCPFKGMSRRKFIEVSSKTVGSAALASSLAPRMADGAPTSSRVVKVHNPNATSWDFSTGYYWQHVDPDVVASMIDTGVQRFTDTASATTAWNTVLASYQPGELVTVKVNTNDMNMGPDAFINVIIDVVTGIIRGVRSAGVPEDRIRVWDGKRPGGGGMIARWVDGVQNVYPSVGVVGPSGSNFNTGSEGLVETQNGDSDSLVNHLIEGDHLITVPICKAISPMWNSTGALKLHIGSVRNGWHASISHETAGMNMLASINGNPHIKDKLRLIVGDFLFGMFSGKHFDPADGYGGQDPANLADEIPLPWQTFGGGAPNSIFVADDPVALDTVMNDFITEERAAQGLVSNYPHPIIDACAEAGLGVHEHKPYSAIDFVEIEDGDVQPDVTPPSAPVNVTVT